MAVPPTPIAAGPPDVSVVIVNCNTENLFVEFFSALEASRGTLTLQIIVVDNASRDSSVDTLRKEYPNIQLIENHANVGFGRANNQALPWIQGRYTLLLNPDAFVAPETLQKTVEFMDTHPGCGVLGVKLVGRDGTLQPSCRYFPTPWNIFLARTGLARFSPGTQLVDEMSRDHASVRQCDWVPGCYYLVRREVIEHVGLFDPRYFLYYEEVDHCFRVRQAGWSVTYYPLTQVTHIGGESAATEGPPTHGGQQISTLQIESQLLYFRKHYGATGVLADVFLSTLADIMTACNGLVRRLDTARAAEALHHTRIMLKLLVNTGFASRATR